jgi:hypothetical protein
MSGIKATKATIVGVDSEKAGFTVSFKNGLDGNLDMKITGVHVDCAGGIAGYSSIEACANYLLDSVKKMKASPQVSQVYFGMDELPIRDGKLNFNTKDGELIAAPQKGEEQ